MKNSDVSRLRELVDLCRGHKCYKARLSEQGQDWCLVVQLDGETIRFWSENPWIMEDWPELKWEGNYFFHRAYPEIATITGVTAKQLNQALGRYRGLQQSRESLAFPEIMELLPPTSLIYLVEGTTRDFSGPIYRPRLRAFKKMVRWAMPEAEVGFTVLREVSESWGYMLISPWLIKSTDPVWLQRIKMFGALNEFQPASWPMSLLIENWSAFREIRF